MKFLDTFFFCWIEIYKFSLCGHWYQLWTRFWTGNICTLIPYHGGSPTCIHPCLHAVLCVSYRYRWVYTEYLTFTCGFLSPLAVSLTGDGSSPGVARVTGVCRLGSDTERPMRLRARGMSNSPGFRAVHLKH